jgi:pilus assembly protein Flp/PilA
MRVAVRQGATREAPLTQLNRGTAAQRTALRAVHTPEGGCMQLVNSVKSFAHNDEGQDLLEYALLVALIALVAVAAVTAAGGSVKTIFSNIATALGAAS